MNGVPLLKSKLLIPGVPARSLYSQRIKDFGIAKNRLTVIVAPAGFGKTTSALLALNPKRENVRWYRMEKEDSLFPVFYLHLMETLFAGESERMRDSMHLLASVRNTEEGYLLLNAHICQEMSAVLQNSKHKIYLVLDDFHNVAESLPIRETVRYLVNNMPDALSIIVTSRVDPQIIDGKMLLRNDIRQIESESLLFTREETERLVKKKYGLDLSPSQLDCLFQCSEGWIFGLYMICHSMDFSDPCDDCMQGEMLEKSGHLFSAFLKEFLQALDEEKRRTLVQLSVLEDFSMEDLRNIFHMADPAAFSSWLETSNLYVQRVAGQTIRYRFHSLFAGELERLFREEYSAEQQREYFARLGEYYRAIDLRMSVRFFLRADMAETAQQMAAETVREQFVAGLPEKAFHLISEFPPELTQKNPYLLLFQGMMDVNVRRAESYDCFMRAIDQFRRNKDYSFLMNTFGMLMVIAFQTNDFQHLTAAAKKIPALPVALSGGEVLTKLIISLFISLIGEDKLMRAIPLRRILDRTPIHDDMWQFSYLMIRGISCYRRGRPREAQATLRQILAHPVSRANDQWRIIGLVSCCNTPFLLRDLAALEEFASEFFLLGERYNSNFALGYGYLMSAFHKYQRSDVSGALAALDKSMESYEGYDGEVLVRESETIRLLWDEATPAAEALPQALENMRYFALERPGHGIAEFAQGVVGVLYKRDGRFREAETHLKKSLAVSRRKGARQSVCGLWLQLADLYYASGETGKAERYLKKWAGSGEKWDYLYFREMDRGSLERVCERAKAWADFRTYGERLAEIYRAEPLSEDVGDREQGKLQVKLFGSFQIRGSDFQITEKDFKTKKVSGVLKYILAGQADKTISRERLAAMFWPDAESKLAFTSLRVTLYELRKTLAQFHMGFESKNALIEEGRDGFFVKTPHRLEIDIHQFEEKSGAWKKGHSEEGGGDLIYWRKFAISIRGIFSRTPNTTTGSPSYRRTIRRCFSKRCTP